VKQTVLVKLDPTPAQATLVLQTLEAFNDACNFLAAVAFSLGCANKVQLQREAYYTVRRRFGLSAQMAIRAVAKVCDAYQRNLSKRPTFRRHGAMVYDERILSWKGETLVSLATLAGRVEVPVRSGEYQAERLKQRQGQCDLLYRNQTFFLAVTLDVPAAEPIPIQGVLGVDLGIVNIATDSDGQIHSAAHLLTLRRRHRRLRRRLQKKGTRSARRLLKKRRSTERRFQRDINHCLSKQIVAKAKGTQRAIALEELTHIRERIRLRKPQRATFSAWAFAQLRAFILYKAKAAGVLVVFVDPRNTSRTCPACGAIDRANRKNQREFVCVSCGCAGHADVFAAENIRRAAVSQPDVASLLRIATSPPDSAVGR
jgi:putative transposase